MASHSVDSSKHSQLTADTVDTVTLGGDFREVMIINRSGDAEIFYTVDDDDPVVAGDDVGILPAVVASVLVVSRSSGRTVVRLISDGTPTYSVVGLS